MKKKETKYERGIRITKQDRQYTCNVTPKRDCVTTVAGVKQ